MSRTAVRDKREREREREREGELPLELANKIIIIIELRCRLIFGVDPRRQPRPTRRTRAR
jgi:hypothetical protein